MRIFKFLSLTLLSLAVTACSSNGNKSETGAADTDSVTVQAPQAAPEAQADSAAQAAPTAEAVTNESLPTLLDFSATWCGPCKAIAPRVHEMEQEYKGKVKFRYIDVDDEPALADQYGIRAVPTFIILSANGKPAGRIEGADEVQLKALLDAAASK